MNLCGKERASQCFGAGGKSPYYLRSCFTEKTELGA